MQGWEDGLRLTSIVKGGKGWGEKVLGFPEPDSAAPPPKVTLLSFNPRCAAPLPTRLRSRTVRIPNLQMWKQSLGEVSAPTQVSAGRRWWTQCLQLKLRLFVVIVTCHSCAKWHQQASAPTCCKMRIAAMITHRVCGERMGWKALFSSGARFPQ